MNITGTIRDGKIEADLPDEWRDGQVVKIRLIPDEPEFLTDETWPTTPEGIEALIQSMHDATPVMTEEEERQFLAVLADSKKTQIELIKKEWGLSQ